MLIPSESCILTQALNNTFRRTVFTSALEGAWTGVGHREMVWCHQVRWRIARAALELGGADSLPSRATLLDKWLRDGHFLPPNALKTEYYTLDTSDTASVEILAPGKNLLLMSPDISNTYLLPVGRDSTSSTSQKFTVLVSRGSIYSVAPQNPLLLRVSIFSCTTSSTPSHSALRCVTLEPDILKLIPNPIFGRVFPVPSEGSDESEGTVLYESHVPYTETEEQWIGVKVDGAEGQGWIAAGLSVDRPALSGVSTSCMRLLLTCKKDRKLTFASSPADGQICDNQRAYGRNLEHFIYISESTIKHSCSISCVPLAIFDAVVLRFVERIVNDKRIIYLVVTDALMAPLLMHTSQETETHYFPLANLPDRRILLHSHFNAPFTHKTSHIPSSLNFTIYSSGELACREEFSAFEISFDWYATLGRCASRYLQTVFSWAAGVVSIIFFIAWGREEKGGACALRDSIH
jgi:glycosylphosphatidylinositol deacylase